MLIVLHGTSVLIIFSILTLNYLLAKLLKGSKLAPVLTWVFNGFVLFANEKYSGYDFGNLHTSLESLVCASLTAMVPTHSPVSKERFSRHLPPLAYQFQRNYAETGVF
jgi:hypothetical protein